MKTLYIYTAIIALFSSAVLAQGINIPQIPSKASASNGTGDESALQISDSERRKDTQAEILNNPELSEHGRASALTSGRSIMPMGDASSEKKDSESKSKEVVPSDVIKDGDVKAQKQTSKANQKKKKKGKVSEEEKYTLPSAPKDAGELQSAPVKP